MSLTPSAQNNVTTAAEYQAAADEITAIIEAKRLERAPLERELDVLRNRAERQQQNQISAYNRLLAAEAGGNADEIAAASTAYRRAQNDVATTGQAQQQLRSVLRQEQLAGAELQDQRNNLEVKAEFADRGPPNLNSLPPPATVVPAQSPSYVPPPPPPVITQLSPNPQPTTDTIRPPEPAAETNVSAAQQWLDTENNIATAARGIRTENAAIAANLAELQTQGAAAARFDRALENQIIDARLAGASDLEISQLEAQQIQAAARTDEFTRQIRRQESVLAQNQQTLDELNTQQNIAEQAYFVTNTGSPRVLSTPGPATTVPGQDPAAYDLPPTTYADNFSPEPVAADGDEALQAFEDAQAEQLAQQEGAAFATPESIQQSQTRGLVQNAQQQNTLNDRVALPQAADWRVRLSLANTANYLYRAEPAGILAPLARTNGVVFPYTPSIETSYQAKYDAVDLTHSNYKGYFYKNSSVDQVSIRGTFTAQDTREAEYLLAVIAFFRSVTKMFYGATDPLAGSPPPLVFLSGLGQYQFNNNPCVVSSFNYSLPSDVDYIRANGFNNYGINLDNRRQQGSTPPATGILGAIATVNRLRTNFLAPGAIKSNDFAQSPVSANNSKTNYTNSTYVPTKMEISVNLLPIQTRSQISSQFNLQRFATGSLLQQGFW